MVVYAIRSQAACVSRHILFGFTTRSKHLCWAIRLRRMYPARGPQLCWAGVVRPSPNESRACHRGMESLSGGIVSVKEDDRSSRELGGLGFIKVQDLPGTLVFQLARRC